MSAGSRLDPSAMTLRNRKRGREYDDPVAKLSQVLDAIGRDRKSDVGRLRVAVGPEADIGSCVTLKPYPPLTHGLLGCGGNRVAHYSEFAVAFAAWV